MSRLLLQSTAQSGSPGQQRERPRYPLSGATVRDLEEAQGEVSAAFAQLREQLAFLVELRANLPLIVNVDVEGALAGLHDIESDLVGELMSAEEHV